MSHNKEVLSAFSKSATTYQQSAVIQKAIGEELLNRLAFLTMKPKRILDLGSGAGYFYQQLKTLYPKAQVIALDISHAMLTLSPSRWFQKKHILQANMAQLPFIDNRFDMVFSNQVVHWADDLALTFMEVARVLKSGGVFHFSTLGPDSFWQLKEAWREVDDYQHANHFLDMHNVGDALLQAGFSEPVMDREDMDVLYKDVKQLCLDLKAQGVKNTHHKRRHGLVGKKIWQAFTKNYQSLANAKGQLPLTYEVVYGQAWRQVKKQTESPHEVTIPISQIKTYR